MTPRAAREWPRLRGFASIATVGGSAAANGKLPDGLVSVTIDAQTGALAGEWCPLADARVVPRWHGTTERSAKNTRTRVSVMDREPRRRDRGTRGGDPEAAPREAVDRIRIRVRDAISALASVPQRLAPATSTLLSLDAIARAAREIDPVFRATPQFEADALGRRIGARILLKVETVNPIRCFKGRGTDFFLRSLNPLPDSLVTASAGNFGQGLAYAARARGVKLEVFAAEAANPLKVARMRELGATVHLAGRDFDDAKAHAREHAARQGAMFVEDGRELAITEGAGSIAVELLHWREPIAAAVVPLGNGALLGGIGAWLAHASPDTRVIGVCAAGAPAMRDSLRAGRVVETGCESTPSLTASPSACRCPKRCEYLAPVVDDVVLVSEGRASSGHDDAARRNWPDRRTGGRRRSRRAHRAPCNSGSLGLVATPLCGSNVLQGYGLPFAPLRLPEDENDFPS